jgi:hypothetical protein
MQDTLAQLRAIFRDALVLGAGAPALLGCTDMVGIENDPGFVEVSCSGTEPAYLDALSPAAPVDYVARGHEAFDGGPLSIVEEVGTPCVSELDRQACLDLLAAPSDAPELILGELNDSFIRQELRATRGGEVIRIRTADELAAFLVPIDTPAEAVLIGAASRFTPTCSRSGTKARAGGFDLQLFTHPGCDGRRRHLLFVSASGELRELDSTLEEDPDPNCVVGRRPAGLLGAPLRCRLSAGAHFARSAELEAASVRAFEVLGGELAAHGAPAAFRYRARAAAADEVRHALAVARLARTLGGAPLRPRVRVSEEIRSLEDIAQENAAEGCVRETYGALVAMHQARCARHPHVRRLYARIAADETRHAALAWDISRWASTRAGGGVRRRVRDGMRAAVDALRVGARQDVTDDLVNVAGLPPSDSARLLVSRLEQTLWRDPCAG